MMEPRPLYGVDFSGAADAGRRVWVARGHPHGEGVAVEWSRPLATLPGGSVARDRALRALRQFIGVAGEAIFGLDVPLGLPASLVRERTWKDFLRAFRARYPSAQEFRRSCWEAAGGRELRRLTEREERAPFSAYNLRLYRQTFCALRDVVGPLVADGRARVLPMQAARPGVPWLLEACPACTLKRLGLYRPPHRPYKGGSELHAAARSLVVERLEAEGRVQWVSSAARAAALGQSGGDALDSALALLAVAGAMRRPEALTGARPPYDIEGRAHG